MYKRYGYLKIIVSLILIVSFYPGNICADEWKMTTDFEGLKKNDPSLDSKTGNVSPSPVTRPVENERMPAPPEKKQSSADKQPMTAPIKPLSAPPSYNTLMSNGNHGSILKLPPLQPVQSSPGQGVQVPMDKLPQTADIPGEKLKNVAETPKITTGPYQKRPIALPIQLQARPPGAINMPVTEAQKQLPAQQTLPPKTEQVQPASAQSPMINQIPSQPPATTAQQDLNKQASQGQEQQKTKPDSHQPKTLQQESAAQTQQSKKPVLVTDLQKYPSSVQGLPEKKTGVSSTVPMVPSQEKLTGQVKNQPHGKADAPQAVPHAHQGLHAPKTVHGRSQVSLNFDDADVYEVVQTIFGTVLKVNYIVDPRVKGRVTFRSVAPVSHEKVLPLMEVILRLNGVAVVEESGLYRIIPISEIAREPAAIGIGRVADSVKLQGTALLQVIPISYMMSTEMVRLITPFLSTNAAVIDVPKSNQIVVVDTDANVKRILQLVSIFDSEQQKQKGPQVFVYHVQNSKAKDIAAILQQIFLGAKAPASPPAPITTPAMRTLPGQSTSQPSHGQPASPTIHTASLHRASASGAEALVSDITKIFANEIINAVIVFGTPEDYEIIKDTIKKIDIVPRQVIIEGVIAQISMTDSMSLGLAWTINAEIGLTSGKINFNPANLLPAKLPGSGFSYVGTDAAGSIKAVISALASQSKAKLLASPHILVSDNREARIQVGQSVPIPTSETYGSSTIAPQRTIQYKDIGIILKVKPQINDSGLVSLDIAQEVSTYSTVLLYADEKQIVLDKTEATTTLTVQDGQTIIIGGLIREDNSKARAGIPFLSKIPVLGYLFGNTDQEEKRNEIIILLTPHVMKTQRDATEVTAGFVDKFMEKNKNGPVRKEDLLKEKQQQIQEQNKDVKSKDSQDKKQPRPGS